MAACTFVYLVQEETVPFSKFTFTFHCTTMGKETPLRQIGSWMEVPICNQEEPSAIMNQR